LHPTQASRRLEKAAGAHTAFTLIVSFTLIVLRQHWQTSLRLALFQFMRAGARE
jgi:hypothetical protein